jgi:hypothetical protein
MVKRRAANTRQHAAKCYRRNVTRLLERSVNHYTKTILLWSAKRFFRGIKEGASGNLTSPASVKPAPPLLTGSNGTTPNGAPDPRAIAADGSFARYNPNSWLDIGVALQLQLRGTGLNREFFKPLHRRYGGSHLAMHFFDKLYRID